MPTETEPAPHAGGSRGPGTSVGVLIAALVMFAFVGLSFSALGVQQVWKNPGLGSFLLLFILGLWPLWTCVLIGYGLAKCRMAGRVYFPEKTPRAIVVLNLVIIVPLILIVAMLEHSAFRQLPREWTWRVIACAAVLLTPMYLVYLYLRAAIVRSRDELRGPPTKE